jgi:RNA polymerase-binding transcription factor DksA
MQRSVALSPRSTARRMQPRANMRKTKLIAARRRLVTRRRAVLERQRWTLALVDEELDTREIEDASNAAELWDARVLSTLSDADVRTLIEIQAALQRLRDGEYGRCVECGRSIDDQRLAVLPETARCFDCAVVAERPAAAVAR